MRGKDSDEGERGKQRMREKEMGSKGGTRGREVARSEIK